MANTSVECRVATSNFAAAVVVAGHDADRAGQLLEPVGEVLLVQAIAPGVADTD
jgi:hypothetical protein